MDSKNDIDAGRAVLSAMRALAIRINELDPILDTDPSDGDGLFAQLPEIGAEMYWEKGSEFWSISVDPLWDDEDSYDVETDIPSSLDDIEELATRLVDAVHEILAERDVEREQVDPFLVDVCRAVREKEPELKPRLAYVTNDASSSNFCIAMPCEYDSACYILGDDFWQLWREDGYRHPRLITSISSDDSHEDSVAAALIEDFHRRFPIREGRGS